jgi:DNA-binding response OmpR family regulator
MLRVGSMTLMSPECLHGRRILVVEDNFLIATNIAAHLQDLGCTVLGPAGTVEDAWKLARSRDLHGATVDYDLHGESTLRVLDELRSRDVPVLIVTAYDPSTLPEPVPGLPILEKPFLPADLQRRAAALFKERDEGIAKVSPAA